MQLPGIGPTTASALVASLGGSHDFKNGRQLAAWAGLVPGQYSSDGKARLGRITKAGDAYRHPRKRDAAVDQFRCMKKQNGADQTCAIFFAGNRAGKGFFYSVNVENHRTQASAACRRSGGL